MFKCEYCESVFEDPKKGQEYCPVCKSVDIDEGDICKDCGEFFSDPWELSNGLCKECVTEAYTPSIGIAYIEENELEKDFAMYLYGGIKFLKMKLEAGDNELTIYNAQKMLMDYCMEDWRDFAATL